MIQITDRDISLMQWMLEQKFMDAGQVRRVFWKESKADSKEVHRRLGELEKAGFIKRSGKDIFRFLLYVVTKEGLRVLSSLGNTRGLPVLDDVDYSGYRHDSEITDFRIWFHNQGFTDWLSERVLAKRYRLRHLPDGMIHHDGQYLAIEYETAQKSSPRYRAIIYNYEMEDQISEILYIVKGERLKARLQAMAAACSKIHFRTPDDLKGHLADTSLSELNFFARKGYACA